MQWPHCLHPLTQPRPPPQLAHGRITPPSLWEPAGPAKRDPLRPQVLRLHLVIVACWLPAHSNNQDLHQCLHLFWHLEPLTYKLSGMCPYALESLRLRCVSIETQ